VNYALQLDWLHRLPHGVCLLWEPWLLWLTVVGHGLTAHAYAAIPVGLAIIALRRPDLTHPALYWWFGAFMVLCSLTHALAILTIWAPVYWLSAGVGLVTGVVSVIAAVKLFTAVRPLLSVMPGPPELSALRARIGDETRRIDDEAARTGVDAPLSPEALTLTKDLLQDIDTMIARAEALITAP
jgi:hypothetical protein